MKDNKQLREKKIIKVCSVGIGANLFLTTLKLFIGFAANSIAIILDAVNNLSDATSSTITIVGTKLANKSPDKKHPFGHGRAEYFSAMLISCIIIYAGVTSLIESVKKIISPETPDYSIYAILFLVAGIFIKLALGLYTKHQGGKLNSDSLVNSGKDALFDAIISLSTLVAAIIFIIFHLSLEAWLGAIISLFIIKSGVEMITETVSVLLGEGYDPIEANKIKQAVKKIDGVRGAYDLVLNNYGPDSFTGSIHIEVPDTFTSNQIDALARKVQIEVFQQFNVVLNTVGIYSYNTEDKQVIEIRDNITKIIKDMDGINGMHGFYMDYQQHTMRFDLVVSFNCRNRKQSFENAMEAIQNAYPEYQIQAAMDADFSEL